MDAIVIEVLELLQAYAVIIEELKVGGEARTENGPVAIYAEWLTATRLELTLSANSKAGFDALDASGLCYQVKSRHISPKTKSVRLRSILNLKDKPFDYLLGVIFDYDFRVLHAGKVPWKVVVESSGFSEHTCISQSRQSPRKSLCLPFFGSSVFIRFSDCRTPGNKKDPSLAD